MQIYIHIHVLFIHTYISMYIYIYTYICTQHKPLPPTVACQVSLCKIAGNTLNFSAKPEIL